MSSHFIAPQRFARVVHRFLFVRSLLCFVLGRSKALWILFQELVHEGIEFLRQLPLRLCSLSIAFHSGPIFTASQRMILRNVVLRDIDEDRNLLGELPVAAVLEQDK